MECFLFTSNRNDYFIRKKRYTFVLENKKEM